jgi:cell wall-associated NlpC family hydrolase
VQNAERARPSGDSRHPICNTFVILGRVDPVMRRSRPIRCALGVVVAMFGALLAVPPVFADSISDQEQEVRQVAAEIDRMHEKVDQLNEQYVTYLNEKAELDAQIVVAQQRIAEQQGQLGILQGQLANVAIEKVMGGNSGVLNPLFTDPTTIDEGLQRDHLARVAVDAGAASTDDYETLLDDLATEQKSLETKSQRALDLATQADESRTEAEAAAVALEEREADAKAELGVLLEQEEQRQIEAANAAYAKQVAEAQAKAAAQASANANKSSTSGSASTASGSTSSGSSSNASTSSGSSANASTANASTSGDAGGDTSSGDSSDSGSSDSGSDGGYVPPVSSRADVAINAARSQIGVPYRFAASSPGVAFDCSGLTAYAWGVAGVGIPHQSAAQYGSTPHIPKEQAQPGDLIYYYSPISHVGIYIGGGAMIHAPRTGTTVSITTVNWGKVVGVSRPG